jgi:RND family efflux transporter MFP subunit
MPPDLSDANDANSASVPARPLSATTAAPESVIGGLSPRGLRRVGLGAAAAVMLVLAGGIVARVSHYRTVSEWTAAQTIPVVSVAEPQRSGEELTLDLPGRLEAYYQAPIYARVNGYIKSWNTDIGTRVKAGQLLAEIEAPDLDQQLMQARADLAKAEANESLAATTAKRWQAMLGTDAVSQQEVDDKSGDFAAKQAMLQAARANLDRLGVLQGFKRILSPFDGIVTARNTDVGALINAGSGASQPLFVVSNERRLRIYVNVPQSYIAQVKPGLTARVSVPERPGQIFTGTVESSSEAVDSASSTTLMQLMVNNDESLLKPGAYANVRFDLQSNHGSLAVPASALIFDGAGLHVATVDANGRVRMEPVKIAQDLGANVEIADGLAANDRVIQNPPDDISAGEAVRILGDDTSGAAVASAAPGSGGGRAHED